MLENWNHVKYPKLDNPVLILTWQHKEELELLEAMETQDIHVTMYVYNYVNIRVNNVQVKTHEWFGIHCPVS